MKKKQAPLEWKSIITSVAPILSSALGGPLASLAYKAIARYLLPEQADNMSVKEIRKFLSGDMILDPRSLEKLKEAEREFATQMRRLDIDVLKVELEDRQSARKRQSETGDKWPNGLAVVILFGFFGVVAFILMNGLGHLDSATAAFCGTLVGYVSAKADQVISYFFGSSRGSKEKTKALSDLINHSTTK